MNYLRFLFVAALCFAAPAAAFWQSRDSNYNIGVSAGGSFATWNPLDTNASITLSNGNLTALSASGTPTFQGTRATASHATGKFYYTVTSDNVNFGSSGAGIALGTWSETTGCGTANFICQENLGHLFIGTTDAGLTTGAWANADVIQFAVDLGGQLIWVRKNAGNWNNNGAANPATGVGGISISAITGTFFPAGSLRGNGGTNQFTANFGATSYAQPAPSGFSNW